MTAAATYRDCPTCGSDDAPRLEAYSPVDWFLAQCKACGFVFLRDPPKHEALQEDFAWERTFAAKKQTSKGSTLFSPIARKIRSKLRMNRDKNAAFRRWFNNGHVLDIGCGDGVRVAEPMTPYGIELSSELHRRADANMRSRGGYCLHGAGAKAIWQFEPEMFDGIVMYSYLEHETDALDVLKGAYRALKPSGGVFVRVPNFGSLNRKIVGAKWCGFRHPDHVNYFTLKSLRELVGRAGFSTRLVNWISLPVDDNVSVLLRKNQSKSL